MVSPVSGSAFTQVPPWFVDAGGVLSTFVSSYFALIYVLFTVLTRPSIGARAVVWSHTPATILTAAGTHRKTETPVTGEALFASALESAGASKCAGGVFVTGVVGSQA